MNEIFSMGILRCLNFLTKLQNFAETLTNVSIIGEGILNNESDFLCYGTSMGENNVRVKISNLIRLIVPLERANRSECRHVCWIYNP